MEAEKLMIHVLAVYYTALDLSERGQTVTVEAVRQIMVPEQCTNEQFYEAVAELLRTAQEMQEEGKSTGTAFVLEL